LKKGTIDSPEKSVRSYHYSLRSNQNSTVIYFKAEASNHAFDYVLRSCVREVAAYVGVRVGSRNAQSVVLLGYMQEKRGCMVLVPAGKRGYILLRNVQTDIETSTNLLFTWHWGRFIEV
jgi:hypothetical protein